MSLIFTLYKGRTQAVQTHNPTICTMKIFILFTLVSVSVCQGQNSRSFSSSSSSSSSFSSSSYEYTKCDSPYNNQDVGKKTCLKTALQNVPALAQGANRLLCHLKNDQNNQDTENYNNVTRELRAIVRCAGCKLDDVLGTGETLENTGDGVGDLLGEILELLGGLLGDLGLAEPVGDLMCKLASGAMTSECLEEITNNDVPELTDNLKKLSCMEETHDVKLTYNALRDVGCMGDDTLDTDALENLTEQIAKMLDPLLFSVVSAVKELPVVSGIVCTVSGIVEDLVNGDGGDGGDGGRVLGGLTGGGLGGLLEGLLKGGDIGRR